MPNIIEILAHVAQEVVDGYVDFERDCPDDYCPGLHAPLEQYLEDNVYTCPIQESRWVECNNCGWTEITNYSSHPQLINGALMCGDCAEQYASCCNCGRMVHCDHYHSECYGSDPFCDRCWDSRGGCHCGDCRDYDDDDDEETRYPGESVADCPSCCGRRIHMDLLTEEFVCDHLAEQLIAQFVPVKLSHPLPSVTAVTPDPEWVDVVADAMDEAALSEPVANAVSSEAA